MRTRPALLLSLLLALLLAPLAPAAAAPGKAKPRVAVLEFRDKTSRYSWYQGGQAVQDMLVTELVKSGSYRVIEREQLRALMTESNLSLSGDIDPKTAVRAGKLLGVEYIVTGSLTELGATDSSASSPPMFGLPSVRVRTQKMEAAVDARAIATTSGEIVWTESARESTSDASVFVAGVGGGAQDRGKLDKVLRPVVKKLSDSLASKALETTGLGGTGDASGTVGKIAKVDGATLFLNVGSEAGIAEGEELDVYRVGDVIKDPDTGEVLGANETKVGRLRVTAVRGPRLSAATAVSGQGFKIGDALRK